MVARGSLAFCKSLKPIVILTVERKCDRLGVRCKNFKNENKCFERRELFIEYSFDEIGRGK